MDTSTARNVSVSSHAWIRASGTVEYRRGTRSTLRTVLAVRDPVRGPADILVESHSAGWASLTADMEQPDYTVHQWEVRYAAD